MSQNVAETFPYCLYQKKAWYLIVFSGKKHAHRSKVARNVIPCGLRLPKGAVTAAGKEGGSVGSDAAIFTGLVLGCIEAKFCK